MHKSREKEIELKKRDKLTYKKAKQEIKKTLYDKFQPINDLVRELEKESGMKLNPEYKISVFNGYYGKVIKRLNEVRKILQESGNVEALKDFLELQKHRERNLNGIKSRFSLDEAEASLRHIREQNHQSSHRRIRRIL